MVEQALAALRRHWQTAHAMDDYSSDSRNDAQVDLALALQELASKRQRPVLCIHGDMDGDALAEVVAKASELKEHAKLSILLKSPGGYIDDAYRMVLILRKHTEDIEVLVPYEAKSVATFFCLAANRIYMGQQGELGPIDPQILSLSGSAKRVSALELFNALDHLLNHSLDSLDAIIRHLLATARMNVPYAIENAQPLLSAITSSLYAKVDFHELGEAGRSLAISEEYAIRVMTRWGYSGMSNADRMSIVRHLVWDYPTHGFVIDLEEAQNIGLKAEKLDAGIDLICKHILTNPRRFIGIEFPTQMSFSGDSNPGESENDEHTYSRSEGGATEE